MKKTKNMNKVVCCVILILATVLLVAGTLNVVLASESTNAVETAKVAYKASKPAETTAATTPTTVENTVEELQFPIVFSTKEGKKALVFLSEENGIYVENGHELPFTVDGNNILVTSPTGAVAEYRVSYDGYLVRISVNGARTIFYRQ